MYNVYTHDKQAKCEKELNIKRSVIKASEQNRDTLTARYKDRINNTLLSLNKDTESIQKHPRAQTAHNTQRSWLKSTGFIDDKERIKESEAWCQWLDTTPAQKLVFKLRPREKSKEIQQPLKFKAKSGTERLIDSISQQKQYLDSSEPPCSKQRSHCKDFNGIDKPNFNGGKEVLRYYHYKTHFKTIESLALDLHSSIRNLSKAEVKKMHFDEKLGMTDNKGQKEVAMEDTLCKEDIMPISSNLLERLGVWEAKRTSSVRNEKSRLGTPKWVVNRIKAKKRQSLVFS